jgi:molybdate transport system substrate-binding protein
MKRILLIALFILLGPALRADEGRELVVFAAASLREVFEDLAHRLEARAPDLHVRLSFAGSQELRAQLEHGARADVFASADQKHMAALVKAGLVGAPRLFARNTPVVIVPRGNPGHLGSFADLPKAGRVIIGDETVPIGTYTLAILERAGADFKQAVLAHVVSRELNVRQILAKVGLGEADAGIVYRTDALAAAGRVEAIDIPASVNLTAEYPIAVVRDAPQPDAARAFVDLLLGPEGRERLTAAGFTVAP